MKKILSYFAFLVLLIFQHNSMAEIHKYTDSYGVINYHWGRSYEQSNIKDGSPSGVGRKEISAFQDFLESDLMRERKYKKRTALNPLGYKYLFPIRRNDYRITQGYNGSYSHNTPQSRYAIDISVPEGTPVYAARSGKVISLRGGKAMGSQLVATIYEYFTTTEHLARICICKRTLYACLQIKWLQKESILQTLETLAVARALICTLSCRN